MEGQSGLPSLAFHSSRMVSNGIQRFAIGMNHQPITHPGVNLNRLTNDSSRTARCARNCHKIQTTNVAIQIHASMPPIVATALSAEPASEAATTSPERILS